MVDLVGVLLSGAGIILAANLLISLVVAGVIWKFRNKLPRVVVAFVALLFIIAGVIALPTVVGGVVLIIVGATLLDWGLNTKLFYPRVERILRKVGIK